jgi:Uma2 family endonuclease
VRGRIVAHAAPSPEHGVIAANLATALRTRLRGHSSGCRVEVGSGAAPRHQRHDTARIPDVTIRCGKHPKVVFKVVSPSELRKWRQRDEKRADLQNVEGVQEIIEIYQSEAAVHVYRLAADGSWYFEAIDGVAAVVRLDSVGLEIPLAEIYEDLDLAEGVTEQ